jgi:DNA/RNA endonuclease YhcR with UshA esterase domain
MQKILLIVAATFIYSTAFCQSQISIDSLKNHYGEKVIICSKVYGTKVLEKVTFINLGAAYPHSLLTLVIFSKDRSNFKEAPEAIYADKMVCVTGILKEYNGKAEIIVTSPDDINIQ